MKGVFEIFSVIVTSAIIENLLFARALGVDHLLDRSRSYRYIFRFGIMVMLVAVLSGMLAWGCESLLRGYSWWSVMRGMVVLLCVCTVYLLLAALLGKRKVRSGESMQVVAAFNGAAFGAVLLALNNRSSFGLTVAYCLGCSVGLTISLLLVHSGRERLELSQVPRAFSGLPVIMVYLGILSLAIYGLIGHQLPT